MMLWGRNLGSFASQTFRGATFARCHNKKDKLQRSHYICWGNGTKKKQTKNYLKNSMSPNLWHNPFKSLQKYEFSYVCKHIGFPALAVFPLPFTSAPAALRSSDFSMYPGLKSSINPIHPIQEAKFPQIAGGIFWIRNLPEAVFGGWEIFMKTLVKKLETYIFLSSKGVSQSSSSVTWILKGLFAFHKRCGSPPVMMVT